MEHFPSINISENVIYVEIYILFKFYPSAQLYISYNRNFHLGNILLVFNIIIAPVCALSIDEPSC
uniref:Uncharacterized protein n=1 Tax=Anguilla anguilla TaxID=7936 RepID=A0A0E9WI06_ANGAN